MEKSYTKLLENNRAWAILKKNSDPDFFTELAQGQNPEYLWIGCSDSRIPANEVTGTKPGEIFVHRNVANLVVHTDMNLLSVLSYAVEVLSVRHVIVCGHYGCGGVLAAMGNKQYGLIDNWLRHLKDIYCRHNKELDAITDEELRGRRFVELNVIEQVRDLCKTSIIQNAWTKRSSPQIHGWVYDIRDGILKDLNVSCTCPADLHSVFHLDK